MKVVALMGNPRPGANSSVIANHFIRKAETLGAECKCLHWAAAISRLSGMFCLQGERGPLCSRGRFDGRFASGSWGGHGGHGFPRLFR